MLVYWGYNGESIGKEKGKCNGNWDCIGKVRRCPLKGFIGVALGLYVDNGKNGNHYLRFRV